ncbi:hypothetical protein ACIPIU_11420 [Streptomyces massasporeus]|uniref:hypothetical protein n=1 Tax=Streptomyces massasporeus TaxID=67324 RepID=UPI0036EDDC25
MARNGDCSDSIKNVSGPDEYSNYKNDAVYTNAVAATALRDAGTATDVLGERAPDCWATIADRLRIRYDKEAKVFRQFEGYDGRPIKHAGAVLLLYPLECPCPTKRPSAPSTTTQPAPTRTGRPGRTRCTPWTRRPSASLGVVSPTRI